jgi:hypothetical protein
MLLLVVMVPVCWCCPRHADRQYECRAAVWAKLLLVCRYCPRQADRECCAVWTMLLMVVMVLVFWSCHRQADRQCCAVWAKLYC